MENETIDLEINRCRDAFEYLAKYKGLDEAGALITSLSERFSNLGGYDPTRLNSAYINSSVCDVDYEYPGDLQLESNIMNIL